MSLRLRLLLALVPLFVLALAAADAGTYTALQSFLVSRIDDQLVRGHTGVEADLLRQQPGGQERGPFEGGGPMPTTLPPNTFGELRTPSGTVVGQVAYTFGGVADPATHPQLPATLTPGTPASPSLLTVPGTGSVDRYRVYVDTARDGSGDLVVVAVPLDDVDSTLTRLLVIELVITGGVTLLLIAASWLIVRRGLRPLERMADTARSIAATDLSRRISPATEKTEVGRLGIALNVMLSQLETAFGALAASEQRLRHFISDASHELRTPLTSMRGYAELFRRKPTLEREEIGLAMRRIEDEAQRMGVLVDDLLLLARLDQGRPLERERVDLEALVTDACADARAADPSRAVSMRIAAPLVVVGDAMRLQQVLGNLLRNALVHTPPATPVEVVLRPEPGLAVIEVVDHGPGIPPDDVERVFERFHRADPERSRDQGGSGLGLSIVAAVVSAHGGRVEVAPTPGGGATFRVELPLGEDIGDDAGDEPGAGTDAAAAATGDAATPRNL